jgi:hypothetical protein
MPLLQINTSILRSKLTKEFVQKFLISLSTTMQVPKESLLVHWNPEQMIYLRGNDEPAAFISLAAAARLGVEENKRISNAIMSELEKIGIPPTRTYIKFQILEKSNVGFDKSTYDGKSLDSPMWLQK